MPDSIAVLTWWVLVQVYALATLPLAFRLFRLLPDRGYGVSKAVGLLLPNYIFWLLGVLGFLRNDSGGILLSLAAAAIGCLLFYSRLRPSESEIVHQESGSTNHGSATTLSSWLRANWKLVLTIEIVFAITFGGWALYRAYVPRIMTAGGEKFMELAFLNGFKRSATLPPIDPWLSGYTISYYYFGYLVVAGLIRLSGVASAVGFNIGGALLFALTATGAFSLVYNLVADRGSHLRHKAIPGFASSPTGLDGLNSESQKTPPSSAAPRRFDRVWILTAALGMVFVVFLSNFEGPLEVAHWKGLGSEAAWKWLDIDDLDEPPSTNQNSQGASRPTRPGWWWWRASRVVFDYDLRDWPNRTNKTADPPPARRENIDEFPFFSFLLGDMHPHVLALPFVMLALTASLTLFHNGVASRYLHRAGSLHPMRIHVLELMLFALIFGALGFLNTWDFPIQWAVAVGAYTLGRLFYQPSNQPTNLRTDLRPHLRPIFTLAATLGIGGLLLYAPFYTGLQSQAGGPLVHVHSSTRLVQFVIMFAPLLYILLAFLAWGIWSSRGRLYLARRTGLWTGATLLLCALGLLLATALVIQLSPTVRALAAPGLMDEQPISVALRYLAMRLSSPWVTVLLVGIISAGVALLRLGGFSQTVRFSLLLVIAGAVMTLVPEYIYLKDVFGVRLNTIFKFYFQAWVLWAVAAAGAVYTLLFSRDRLKSNARTLFGSGLTLMVGLGLVYPLLAISDRTNEFPEAPTLDGTAYYAQEQAADYKAIQWLNANISGAPVILETPGGAYQYEGRVSTQTGLPTLLGWAGHEHQWRGNTVEQSKRLPVIEELCSTSDDQRTLTLLREHDITYVYVGPLERSRCPASSLEKFDRLMEIVYDQDGVRIYTWRHALRGHISD